MKRISRKSTSWTYFLIRKRYQEKRQKSKWKNRKRNKKLSRQWHNSIIAKHKKAPYIDHKAPENFSFINNTDEVLEYFNKAKTIFHNKENVNFDISDVTQMTPDTIALLVASVNNSKFIKTGNSKGNAPKDDELRKIFTESGFGEYVSSSGFRGSKSGNLLHKEVNKKVVPKIAKNSCILGLEHVFKEIKPFPPLYEILIECMSNTHNHANLNIQGECKWWLYVYNNPKTKTTSYSFLDLGVGIFESTHIKNYITKILKIIGAYQNIDLVDDLLKGKIHSRIEIDRELRGKGIPQIVNHSKNTCFRNFFIITNNVKIDLTNRINTTLKQDFNGTFFHFELVK